MRKSTALSQYLFWTLLKLSHSKKDILAMDDVLSFDGDGIDLREISAKTKHISGVRIPRTIAEQGALFFFELAAKPLKAQNPRQISVISILLFFYIHGYWLLIAKDEFLALVIWIETSPKLAQKETIEAVAKIFAIHLIKLTKPQ